MKKILIIDDSPFIAMEIKEIVTDAGYEVVAHSRSGEDGIRKYKEFSPDIVTLDIIMPGMDGIETANEIRRIDPNASLIMLSSLCDEDTKRELEQAGLKFMTEKPIDREELLKVLYEVSKL